MGSFQGRCCQIGPKARPPHLRDMSSRCPARLFEWLPGLNAIPIHQLAFASLSWGGDTLQAADYVLSDGARVSTAPRGLSPEDHNSPSSQTDTHKTQPEPEKTQLLLPTAHPAHPTHIRHLLRERQATPRVVASALPRTVLFSQPRSRRTVKPGGSPRASVPQQEVTNTATGKKAAGPW